MFITWGNVTLDDILADGKLQKYAKHAFLALCPERQKDCVCMLEQKKGSLFANMCLLTKLCQQRQYECIHCQCFREFYF